MENSPDAIIVGLGAAGAAAACELARRGAAVLAIDAATPPHDLGSSHGRSRITREAYYEHPLYVPLVQRALELWLELEELTGTVIFRQTGGLMVGSAESSLLRGALHSARAHGLEHELLTAEEVQRRFRGLTPQPDHVAVLEPRAGLLNPEAGVRTMLSLARGWGAELRTDTRAVAWHVNAAGDVVVDTSSGRVSAPLAVFAAGPWLNPLLAAETGSAAGTLQLPLTIERQTSHWFTPAPGVHSFRAEHCPIGLWEHAPGRIFYTLPDSGHGVKGGIHHEGDIVDPERVDRTVGVVEVERVRRLFDWCMPGAAQTWRDASVCLYTNTPDAHFLIDRHPAHEQVMLISACSGHGFKFATAIGEAVAEWLLEGGSRFDLAPFGAARLLT